MAFRQKSSKPFGFFPFCLKVVIDLILWEMALCRALEMNISHKKRDRKRRLNAPPPLPPTICTRRPHLADHITFEMNLSHKNTTATTTSPPQGKRATITRNTRTATNTAAMTAAPPPGLYPGGGRLSRRAAPPAPAGRYRYRVNMAHIRQSRPDSGLGLQSNVFQTLKGVPTLLDRCGGG